MPQRQRGHGREQLRIAERIGFGFHQKIGQNLPRQQRALAILHRAAAGNEIGLLRERRQQPLRKGVDRIDPQPAAGTIEHSGKQRTRARHRGLVRRRADRIEMLKQVRIGKPHPFRQRIVDTRSHLCRPGLGERQTQDLRWGDVGLQQKPQHARRQHLRLAGPCRGREPYRIARIHRRHLVAMQRIDLGRTAHAPSSALSCPALSRRPSKVIHSSRRINWSKSEYSLRSGLSRAVNGSLPSIHRFRASSR